MVEVIIVYFSHITFKKTLALKEYCFRDNIGAPKVAEVLNF